MSELRDSDGTPLLTNTEVAALAGVEVKTINHYNARRQRLRKPHGKTPEGLLPRPVRRVKQTFTRTDGKPVTVWVRLWREDQVKAWIERRRP